MIKTLKKRIPAAQTRSVLGWLITIFQPAVHVAPIRESADDPSGRRRTG